MIDIGDRISARDAQIDNLERQLSTRISQLEAAQASILALNDTIIALRKRVAELKDSAESCSHAMEHQDWLGEWLVDAVTDSNDDLTANPVVDARLRGEDVIPCHFTYSRRGRNYQIDLVSTKYEVKELDR